MTGSDRAVNDALTETASEPAWPYPFSRKEWEQLPPGVRAYIAALEQRIADLEARLNRNSKNSNQPPSTDSPFKKPTVSEKKKSPKKAGGRKGHKGHRHVFLEPTRVENHLPERCDCGGVDFSDISVYYTHQQIELPEIKPDVIHHCLHQGTCIACGDTVQTTRNQIPPAERPGFGPRMTAFVALMAGVLGSSRRDIVRLLSDVLAVPISLGGLQKCINRASEATKPHHTTIGALVRAAAVNFIDETSWRSQRLLRWLWVMTNQTAAFYLVLPGRSRKDFQTLIGHWAGILVSDDYALYRKWVKLRQTCLAHLIRKAQKLAESTNPAIANFGRRIKLELKLACRMAHQGRPPPTWGEWKAHYMRVVGLLYAHNERKDEAGKLARALVRQLDNLWVFLEVNGVEPTNNRSERALRFAVILRRLCQGTKSEKGERWIERTLSLRETSRLRGQRCFPLLVDAVRAHFEDRAPDLSWLQG